MINKKNQEAIAKVLKLYKSSYTSREAAITKAKECKRYINHNQFTEAEKKAAADNSKPLLRYNLLVGKLNTLIGNEQLSRRSAKFYAQGWSDEKIIELLNENYESVIDKNDLESILVSALADALIYPTGGWIRRDLKLDDMGYLSFVYENIDTFDVHPDPEHKKSDLSDANYIIFEEWLTKEAILSKFRPNKLEKDNTTWWENVSNSLLTDSSERGDGEYKAGERYLVLYLEERVHEVLYVIMTDEGSKKLKEKEYSELEKSGVPFQFMRKVDSEKIHLTTIAPHFENIILQDKDFPFHTDRFSVFPVYSFNWNMRKADQASLIYLLLDIQDSINKRMSQQIDFVTQALGQPWFVGKHDKSSAEQLRTSGNQPGKVIEINSTIKPPIKAPAPTVDPSILQTVMTDREFIDNISSVTPAMEGKSERSGETGVLYNSKVGQGKISTNPYHEALAKVRQLLAQDFIELVPYVYFEDDRVMEVKKSDIKKSPRSGLNFEMINVNYDGNIQNDIRNVSGRAILDEGDNTPNQLENEFNQNMAFANILISSGASFTDIPWDLLVKHSTIKDKDKWQQFFAQRLQIQEQQIANQRANEDLAAITAASK